MAQQHGRQWYGSMFVWWKDLLAGWCGKRSHYGMLPKYSTPNQKLQNPETFGFLSIIPMMTLVFDHIVTCFKKDGPRGEWLFDRLIDWLTGTSYDQYSGFHAWMAASSTGDRNKTSYLNVTVPSVPNLHDDLTKGISIIDLGMVPNICVFEPDIQVVDGAIKCSGRRARIRTVVVSVLTLCRNRLIGRTRIIVNCLLIE